MNDQSRRAHSDSREGIGLVPIFLHIPKAAGRSMLSVLRDNYGADKLYEVYSEPPQIAEDGFFAMSAQRRQQFDAVAGHLRFGFHEHIPRRSAYLTVLRDPIKRVLSTYSFVRRKTSHPEHEAIVSQNLSIEEVIRSGLLPMLDNGQTRALSGVGADVDTCTPDMLERAKANVETHFSVVGFLERFDETLLLCGREFGWSVVRNRRRNAAPGPLHGDPLTPETVTALAETNRLDLQLYEWALGRFNQKVAQAGPAFARQVRTLRLTTRLRGIGAVQPIRKVMAVIQRGGRKGA